MADSKYLDNARFVEGEFRKLFERFKNFPTEGMTDDRIRHGKILLGAVLFCLESCELTVVAIERGFSLHEITLARPAMDLAHRMVFANRVKDGWARYEKYWLEDYLKWANKDGPKNLPEHQATFDAWGAETQTRLDKLKGLSKMPDKLPDLIGEIFATEREFIKAGKEGMEPKKGTGFLYHTLFKVAHAVTHGDPAYLSCHLDDLANERGYKRLASTDLAVAAGMMLRAVYLFCGWPNRERDCKALLDHSTKLLGGSHKS